MRHTRTLLFLLCCAFLLFQACFILDDKPSTEECAIRAAAFLIAASQESAADDRSAELNAVVAGSYLQCIENSR